MASLLQGNAGSKVNCTKQANLRQLAILVVDTLTCTLTQCISICQTGNPVEGDFCAFKDSTGAYYRAQVLKFSQPLGLYFYHKEQARVSINY